MFAEAKVAVFYAPNFAIRRGADDAFDAPLRAATWRLRREIVEMIIRRS